MSYISNKEIDFMLRDFKRKGITDENLLEEMLDHFCCSIDDQMESGIPFISAYYNTIGTFGLGGLRKVQVKLNHHETNRKSKVHFIHGLDYIMSLMYLIGSIVLLGLPLLFASFAGNLWVAVWFSPFTYSGYYILKNGIDYKKLQLRYLY